MVKISLIPIEEFRRIRTASIDKYVKLSLIADMCRVNALSVVKRAGSGHLGSSFSAMDIVIWLYHEEMNTISVGHGNVDRDIYFSSKGHDVPGLYTVLFSFGIIPQEKFLKLRRLGGLDGHPDVDNPGIEANSGSLGMGISKGRGISWAKRLLQRGGRVFVMIGDGELQEGQNYEAFQTTVQQRVTNLTVILDHNKIQSDKPIDEIVSLGDIERKFRGFGWYVTRCDGHDFRQLEHAFTACRAITDRPQIIIADTLKGCGVSFMEHPTALKNDNGYYKWHAGAPEDMVFLSAHEEVVARINQQLRSLHLSPVKLDTFEPPDQQIPKNALGEPVSQGADSSKLSLKATAEYVADAYGKALVEIAARRADLVVLDADLAADCRVREFELTYPERFIENGIAEQDMVSMAGGLARHGLLPVVNSFASFLASRANEQIYNNATEGSKIIYACHYAGLIPAGPGKSHQSIRDISLLSSLPNMIILQPCNPTETQQAVEYAVDTARDNVALRLVIGPSPRNIYLSEDYTLTFGQGISLTEGNDALLFAYGPVMLHEALLASETLKEQGFALKVVNMPWLNRLDIQWIRATVMPYHHLFVLEDHAPIGGLGDTLLNAVATDGLLEGRQLIKFAVEGYPAYGTPAEALQFHRLDGASLAERILHVNNRSE